MNAQLFSNMSRNLYKANITGVEMLKGVKFSIYAVKRVMFVDILLRASSSSL